MKALLLTPFLLTLTACQTAPVQTSDRVFNINGQWVEISKEMQKDLRSRWSKEGKPVRVNTRIPTQKDTIWVLDTIALQTSIADKEECKKYEITEVTQTNISTLSSKDKELPIGRLDETWYISQCGKSVRYRVVELSDERGVTTYKLMP